MDNMQQAGNDILRPEGSRDPYGAQQGRDNLHLAYDWLEANLGDGPWAAGEQFTLADCAAAPSLVLRRLGRGDRSATGRSSPPIAPGSWRIRSSPARSTKAARTAPISRWERPTATRPEPRISAAADRPRSPRRGAARGCGRRRSCRGDSGARGASSSAAAHGGRRPRRGRAPPARAARPGRTATASPPRAGAGNARRSHRAGRRSRSTGAAGRRRWPRTCGSAGPSRTSGDWASVISSGLMPSKKLYLELCWRTWSRQRKRQLPGPSKLAGWSGALNSPGSAQPGTAHFACAPSTRPCNLPCLDATLPRLLDPTI